MTISATNVATVHLAPATPNTLVFGVPFGYPPARASIPGYARTSLSTTAGLINIDTIIVPVAPPDRFTLPSIAVISIIPPGPPCRASTNGTTVVFTPIARAARSDKSPRRANIFLLCECAASRVAPCQVLPLDRIGGEFKRVVIAGAGFLRPVEPTEQIGAHRLADVEVGYAVHDPYCLLRIVGLSDG